MNGLDIVLFNVISYLGDNIWNINTSENDKI